MICKVLMLNSTLFFSREYLYGPFQFHSGPASFFRRISGGVGIESLISTAIL